MTVEHQNQLIGTETYLATEKSIGIKAKILLRCGRELVSDKRTADSLENRMHNNSQVSGSHLFGNERPASAYFTLTKENLLIIEWGKINPNGEAKLHDFLNDHVDYQKRIQEG